jgi:signal transduction histidine kinase
VGFLVHELRNAISTATLAVGAIEFGYMAMSGATGAVLKRSLVSLTALINHAVSEVRHGVAPERVVFGVAPFLADADATARLDANASNCRLTTLPAESSLRVAGNRALLLAALANLLQNAFKFTTPHTDVTLSAHIAGERVLIEVADHCGGLPPGAAEHLFVPFSQRNDDKSGLGLGLAIARDNVEADGGTLSVWDVPGCGCIFTISLHAHPDEGPGPRSA